MYNERICFTNNHNGRNYGGDGEIAIVDDDGNTIEIINEDKVESGGFWTPHSNSSICGRNTIIHNSHAFEPNIRRRTCDKK